MESVNGKTYSMWGGIVDNKTKMIGGTLIDVETGHKTDIVDITIEPSGSESAWLEVKGENFNCGVNLSYARLSGAKGGGLHIDAPSFAGFIIKDKSTKSG